MRRGAAHRIFVAHDEAPDVRGLRHTYGAGTDDLERGLREMPRRDAVAQLLHRAAEQ